MAEVRHDFRRRFRLVAVAIAIGGAVSGVGLALTAPWEAGNGVNLHLVDTAGTATTVRPTPAVPSLVSPGAGSTVNLAYGSDPAQRLDVYEPGPGVHPVVIWIHGGGWIGGSKADVPTAVLNQLARGYAVISIEYRLAPAHRFPAAVEDVKLAVRWIKANATGLRIRPGAIIAWGGSAGGYLAAMLGSSPGLMEPLGLPPDVAAQTSAVAAVVDMAGPSDLTTFWKDPGMIPYIEREFLGCDPSLARPTGCDPTLETAATIASYLSPASPPAFLAYGTADPFVAVTAQGDRLAQAWARARGSQAVVYDRVINGGHVFDGAGTDVQALEQFIDQVATGRLR